MCCRKGSTLSTPQDPHQPGQPDAGQQPSPHLPEAPQQQPVLPSEPQYAGFQPSPQGQYQGQYQGQGQNPAAAYYGAPGYNPGPSGLPGQPPPVKSRKKLWIILGSVGGVLLLVIIGVIFLVNLVGGATSQATGRADAFNKLLISGDTDEAYGYLDPALHVKMPKQSFVSGIAGLRLNDTCKPTYNDVKVSSNNGANSADVAGLIKCDADKRVSFSYRFGGTDEPKLVSFKLEPQG